MFNQHTPAHTNTQSNSYRMQATWIDEAGFKTLATSNNLANTVFEQVQGTTNVELPAMLLEVPRWLCPDLCR
jgi:hypothetical protein